MNNLIGIAQSGLATTEFSLETVGNNLANANTPGYGELQSTVLDQAPLSIRPANTVLANTVLAPDLVEGSGAAIGSDSVSFSNDVTSTGVPTNLAIQGNGFFVVTTPGGQTAYTRAGAFSTDANGTLVLPDGSVTNPPIKIPGNVPFSIGPDGTVTNTDTHQVLGKIQLATFVNPGGLRAIGHSLFQPSQDSGAARLGSPGQGGVGSLLTGALNASGVSMTQSMVSLVQAQSAYLANTDGLKVDQAILQTTDTL